MRVSAAALPRFSPPGPGPRGPSSAPGYGPASPPSSPLPARLGSPGRGVPFLLCHGGAPSMPCSALPSLFPPRGLGRARRRRVPAPSPLSLGIRIPATRAGAWPGSGAARELLRGSRAWPGFLTSSSSSKGGSERSCLPLPVRGAGAFRAPILPELRGKRRLQKPGSARLGWEGAAGCLASGVVSGSLLKFPVGECSRRGRRGDTAGVPPAAAGIGAVRGTKFSVGLVYPLEPALRGSQGTFPASQELSRTKTKKPTISTDAERLKQFTS